MQALYGLESLPTDQLSATRALASLSEEALAARLRAGGIVAALARGLLPALQQLVAHREEEAEMHVGHDKFQQQGTFELKFANLNTFFGGLEAQIGPPEVHVGLAIVFEHTSAADSNDAFTTSNYGVHTTPSIEYAFVAEPERDVEWPTEAKLADDDASEMRRRPMPIEELDKLRREMNELLRVLVKPELLREEGIGARLYTGPMYA